ncbi:hypothetical protein ACVWWU_000357 [Pantoea sp. PA1]|jgi:hypothetical protein|uniref:Uncharacterized protein n=1 Tax=Pantoea ananas TaxID=553 RepID=A0A8A4JY16_PANAN|nr:hypothetical protein [Pantoea ananatis]MDH0053675.1 hypothetical protein [Pantoea ananatis]QTC44508.1 hypothetical protein H0Z12_12180 [Pantoea ananatis]
MLKSKDYSKAEGYASLAKALGNTATNELVSHTVKTSSVNDLEMPGNLLKLECENSVENLATWCTNFHLAASVWFAGNHAAHAAL